VKFGRTSPPTGQQAALIISRAAAEAHGFTRCCAAGPLPVVWPWAV